MSIISPATLLRHRADDEVPDLATYRPEPHRIPQPVMLPPGRRSIAALAELRMNDPRGQQLRQQLNQRPWPGLMHAVGATHAACLHADIVLDDLSDLAESWIDLLEPLKTAGADHAVRMLLLPVAALLAEPLDGGAHSTWDHREIGKPVGRELGTDDTGTEATS